MKVIRGLRRLRHPLKRTVLTIGVFDGVHIGHREIIKRIVSRSGESGMDSVVVTFDPHPLKILRPRSGAPSLISLNHRISLIGQLGVDYLVILRFTESLAGLSPEEFVKDILVDRIGAKEIYIGEDFYFGKGAGGSPRTLRALARTFGLKIKVIKPVKVNGTIASSSVIRKFIMRGDLEKAKMFLGRPVSVLGTVVSGAKLASKALGYPTANINPHHEVIPPSGVYAVMVRYNNRYFKGILNIGTRPTFYSPQDREPTIEVHIFDFHKVIYGKDIEVLFICKIRNEFKFGDKDDLLSQIKRDELMARAILR